MRPLVKGQIVNKLMITKLVASTLVGMGTTKIVKAVIQNNIAPEGIVNRITVTAGSMALGGAASDLSRAYTNGKIDQAAEMVNQFRKN